MEKQDFNNLVQGLKEAVAMRRGELAPGGKTMVKPVDVKQIRKLTGQSQADFARMMWISPRTLQNWEQGRNYPTGPAVALLRAIAHSPQSLVKALSDHSWLIEAESAPAKGQSRLRPSSRGNAAAKPSPYLPGLKAEV
ncbi:MAG: helix-turn-helix domain-containing protein [Nitrosospira sp.]|nr:helix-turn-helix domain-containing protein [Nitrosospira sp.]